MGIQDMSLWMRIGLMITGLYTDESPGLKVDPVVVLVLSLVFIFSVVALHSMFFPPSKLLLLPFP
jgi:preprotein translocase subunit Sec61beta